MDHLLYFFHSEHDDDFLDVDFQMPHNSLVVAPSLDLYTVSTVLFFNMEEQMLQSKI